MCNGYLFKEGSNSEEKWHWFGFFEVCRSWESGRLLSLMCPLASERSMFLRVSAPMEPSSLNLARTSGFPFSGLMPYPRFPLRIPWHTFLFRCFDCVSLKLGLPDNNLSIKCQMQGEIGSSQCTIWPAPHRSGISSKKVFSRLHIIF